MTDVKSKHERTCYCGTWPREEYGARCPSCAAIVPEPERQYWLTARETEWLRQHVPVAQWPPGWLEYWLGVRVEGVQQEVLASGTWGTGAPSAERLRELASEPSWRDRDGDGTESEPEDGGSGGAPDEPAPGPLPEPGPHPGSSTLVRDALRTEDLDLFVAEAVASGVAPDAAVAAWRALEDLDEAMSGVARRYDEEMTRGVGHLAGQHPDRYRTVEATLSLVRACLDYLRPR